MDTTIRKIILSMHNMFHIFTVKYEGICSMTRSHEGFSYGHRTHVSIWVE